MNQYSALSPMLRVLATGGGFVGFLAAAWLFIVIPVAVAYAKKSKHRGTWWALYVLGLHGLLAPAYRALLRRPGGINRSVARLITFAYQLLTLPTGADIPLSARLGKSLFMGHTSAIVMHTLSEVGDCCVIPPGLLLGGDARGGAPKIGKNVYMGGHVVIVGRVVVGDSATIGAGAVVTKDVPPFALVVGNPASVVKENYRRSYHYYAKEAGCE